MTHTELITITAPPADAPVTMDTLRAVTTPRRGEGWQRRVFEKPWKTGIHVYAKRLGLFIRVNHSELDVAPGDVSTPFEDTEAYENHAATFDRRCGIFDKPTRFDPRPCPNCAHLTADRDGVRDWCFRCDGTGIRFDRLPFHGFLLSACHLTLAIRHLPGFEMQIPEPTRKTNEPLSFRFGETGIGFMQPSRPDSALN